MKRKIILNLAISLDGYIADEKGGFNWIVGDGNKINNTEKQFIFDNFLENIDVVVMGKKAYLDNPPEGMEMIKAKKILIASHEKLETKYKNVEFISGDVCDQILKMRKNEGKNIWVFGGAGLADQFIKAGIIDEYIIGIIPVILGKGIKLFFENNPKIELNLNECTVTDGITMLRYTKKK